MKKILFISALICWCSVAAVAQYVDLPDSNFRNYLRWNYPACFNAAGQLDTTCSEIVNEDSIRLLLFNPSPSNCNLQGIRYFKNLSYLYIDYMGSNSFMMPELPSHLKTLKCDGILFVISPGALPSILPLSLERIYCSNSNFIHGNTIPGAYTQLPDSLLELTCSYVQVDSLPELPSHLLLLACNQSTLRKLPILPGSLKYLDCSANFLDTLPLLPLSLTMLNCRGNYYIRTIPSLPPNLDTLICDGCKLNVIPDLPAGLKYLNCSQNYDYSAGLGITSLPAIPASLRFLDCSFNKINSLPALPQGLVTLKCTSNLLASLPALPDSLIRLSCDGNSITVLPNLPAVLRELSCTSNPLHSLPPLPDSLRSLSCGGDSLAVLPLLPQYLTSLFCGSNQLTSLPQLPPQITTIGCASNLLTGLPSLPPSLISLYCNDNSLSGLPPLPKSLIELVCFSNNIFCLPVLPDDDNNMFRHIIIDNDKIKCVANMPNGIYLEWTNADGSPGSGRKPLCNPTNNVNHCESFPVMQGLTFHDNNSNGVKDAGEPVKINSRISLSNGKYTFTSNSGQYEIGADSIGIYSLTAETPRYFRSVPVAYNYNFTNYDTLVINNFALQIDSIVDELTVKITPINWAARPGFSFPYMISYENTGTTTLSPNIVFDYDQAKINYNTSSVAGITDNADKLSYPAGTLVPGQRGSFISYFMVKPNAALGDTLNAKATISANNFAAYDSVLSVVRGAFDPNDKQATPQLSPSQVANGEYIDYTIRFQNTGTDTAFNIVISDTLSSDLQWSSLEMTASSHNCKVTVKDNVVFFEFLDIQLPDSNVNEPGSHGFVSFKIKPQPTVAVNTTINNKAAIYFDYNAPVITNTVGTLIKNFIVVPLRLISFSAVPQNDNTTLLSWNTANEINTKQFVIERSNDAVRFTALTNIVAKGRANNNYTASVPDMNTGIVYYRLKIVDNDGSFSYSPVIKIDRRKNAAGISILNNPVKDNLVLNISDRSLNNTNASIINMQGAVVKTFIIKEGAQPVNIHELPAGVYYLSTVNGSNKFVIR